MCVIYGVCKVHPNSVRTSLRNQGHLDRRNDPGSAPKVQFNNIIDAYKEINKQRVAKAGHLQLNVMKSTSVSWVYIDVPLDPESEEPRKEDIIQFYNKVFLERMKVYILETKKVKLEQGSRTPILNASNFQSLLTPGGRRRRPGIDNFCALTPLIDSVSKKSRADRTIYQNMPM